MAKTNVKAVSKTTSKPTKKQTDPKAASAKDLLKNLSKPMTQNSIISLIELLLTMLGMSMKLQAKEKL